MTDQQTGTISRVLSATFFITPTGERPDDRDASVFCHIKALERSGVAAHAVTLGTRLRFSTKSGRYAGSRPDAFAIEVVA
jgi:hypothetical protein